MTKTDPTGPNRAPLPGEPEGMFRLTCAFSGRVILVKPSTILSMWPSYFDSTTGKPVDCYVLKLADDTLHAVRETPDDLIVSDSVDAANVQRILDEPMPPALLGALGRSLCDEESQCILDTFKAKVKAKVKVKAKPSEPVPAPGSWLALAVDYLWRHTEGDPLALRDIAEDILRSRDSFSQAVKNVRQCAKDMRSEDASMLLDLIPSTTESARASDLWCAVHESISVDLGALHSEILRRLASAGLANTEA